MCEVSGDGVWHFRIGMVCDTTCVLYGCVLIWPHLRMAVCDTYRGSLCVVLRL